LTKPIIKITYYIVDLTISNPDHLQNLKPNVREYFLAQSPNYTSTVTMIV